MADETPSAPPAADAGAAPVAAPTDAPMTEAELIDAIHQLSPDEARALHDEYAAWYHQRSAPLTPSTPAEADARLAQLINDPVWAGKLVSGDLATRDEFHRLNELKANATVFDAINQTPDVSFGPGLGGPGLSRRDQIDAAGHLRSQGASDAELELIFNDQPYPADIVRDARNFLPQMESDPNFQVLLPGYREVSRERLMGFFRRALAVGDGSGW
jgi:hypothetical protein